VNPLHCSQKLRSLPLEEVVPVGFEVVGTFHPCIATDGATEAFPDGGAAVCAAVLEVETKLEVFVVFPDDEHIAFVVPVSRFWGSISPVDEVDECSLEDLIGGHGFVWEEFPRLAGFDGAFHSIDLEALDGGLWH
jgi:hypothetical protein